MEAEQFVLGSILLAWKVACPQAIELLAQDDFFVEKHRRIFAAMIEMFQEGEAIDYMTLRTRLMFHGHLESVGGEAYITGLTDGLPQIENIESYCQIVKEASDRRRIIFLAQNAQALALDAGTTSAEIASRCVSELIGIGQQRVRVETLREFAEDFPGGIETLLDPTKLPRGITTGFRKLDDMVTGLHRGDLVLIAARPSMGKTAFALSIALWAAKQSKRVVLFSLEMAKIAIFHRLVCMVARVDLHRFRAGWFNTEERRMIAHAHSQIVSLPFHIDDTAGATIEQIQAECRRLASRVGGLDLVLIDYLQLVSTKATHQNRNAEVTAISRALKQLARQADVPVVALSQLSRAPEIRSGDARPRLSDLRESGSLEQDADIVLFIFREEVYKPDREDLRGVAELLVSKQRNGPTGRVDLTFIHKLAKFENRAEDVPDDAGPAYTATEGRQEAQ